MRNLKIFTFVGLFSIISAILILACSKEKLNSTPNKPEQSLKNDDKISEYKEVYIYKGKEYCLYFNDASENAEPLNVEVAKELEELIGNVGNVTSCRFGRDMHNIHVYDNEDELYNDVESKDAKTGRSLHFFYRIEQIQEQLTSKYGKILDYRNGDLLTELRSKLKSAYKEFKVKQDVPNDLTDFFKSYEHGESSFSSSGVRGVVTQFWEHGDYAGQSFIGENVGVISTFGPFNCYTTCSISNLQNVPRGSGNFNDCISSFIVDNAEGADATGITIHRDANFPDGNCQKEFFIVYKDDPKWIGDNPTLTGFYWCFWGGKLNDSISSIRSKACWKGCQITFSDID